MKFVVLQLKVESANVVVVHKLEDDMKSLVKKKNQQKTQAAQCCAKQSRIVAGCHD